jgi:hypothetical protein
VKKKFLVKCGGSIAYVCVIRGFWHYHTETELHKFWDWNFLCKLGAQNRNVSKINWKLQNFFCFPYVGTKHFYCTSRHSEISLTSHTMQLISLSHHFWFIRYKNLFLIIEKLFKRLSQKMLYHRPSILN